MPQELVIGWIILYLHVYFFYLRTGLVQNRIAAFPMLVIVDHVVEGNQFGFFFVKQIHILLLKLVHVL